jgi:hypothetical protein
MAGSSPHRAGVQVIRGGRGDGRDLLRDELSRELLAAPLIANLATLNADGTIHLVAMWFRWDGKAILIPHLLSDPSEGTIDPNARRAKAPVRTPRRSGTQSSGNSWTTFAPMASSPSSSSDR